MVTRILKIPNRRGVGGWLASRGVKRVLVISPHLDDAVFSTGGLLSAVPGMVQVVTEFSEGSPETGIDWAQAAGFQNSMEEHAARRQEDRQAMIRIGCDFQHLGLRSGELTQSIAREHASVLLEQSAQSPSSTLVLLPAGAGAHRLCSSAERWIRRILRRPFGSAAHPDHESTRDCFLAAFSPSGVQLGFYAEIPYIWNETETRLKMRLSKLSGKTLEHVRITANTEEKLALAEIYRSQANLILGQRGGYRRSVLNRKECFFLINS